MNDAEDAEPEELLRRAQNGNATALGQLLARYDDYLSLLARLQIGRRLQGKVDASDLVQETFFKAHRDFAGFRGATEAELVAWLRRILATSVADLVRRYVGSQRRDVRLERQLAEEMDRSSAVLERALAAPHSTPSQQAARREQSVRLATALGRLPAHYREVIILHHLEGLTLAQTAARLGRTEDSVEKLWTRALLQLRRALGESP